MAKDMELEEALNKIQEPEQVETPTAPEPVPVKETAEPTPPAVASTAEKKEDVTPPEPTPTPEKETPSTEPKLYAGKYTNVFDLTHSIQEAGKALGKENKEFISLFEEAQKSGDWTKAEAKYKELQGELTKKQQEEKKTQAAPETPVKEPAEPEVSKAELHNLYLEQANKRIANSPIVLKMARLAHSTDKFMIDKIEDNPNLKNILLRLPQTEEELDILDVYLPSVASEYRQTFGSLYNTIRKESDDYLKIEREAPTYNETTKQSETKQINDLMTKLDAILPKEEVDKWLDTVLQDPTIYELKSGIPYLRAGQLQKRFISDNYERLHTLSLEKVRAEVANKSSVNTAETLANLKEKSIQSIGTSNITPQKKLPVKVDLNDDKTVRGLSTEAKEKAFKDAIDKL